MLLVTETKPMFASETSTVTLGQAARLTGLGKTTLSRAIKAGRLSATRTDTGEYRITLADLARVYPLECIPVAEAKRANGIADLKLAQDLLGRCGVELHQHYSHFRGSPWPLRLTLLSSSHGRFEACVDLSLREAEQMRDWLDAFIADEKARYKDRATKLVGL